MPTIEIISINATGLGLDQEDFKIAIIEEKKLRSHRGLFRDSLKEQKGVIVHIGNPEMKNGEGAGFWADKIIDWEFEPYDLVIPQVDTNDPTDNWGANQQYLFKFLDEYKNDIDKILKMALDNSPIKKVCFLTDYQFGPEHGKTEIIYTISDFWNEHDENGLCLNTMYEMYGR